jgi:hypothetical protein
MEIVMQRVKLVVAGLLVATPALAVADDTEMMAGGGGGETGGAVEIEATSLIARPYVVGSGKLGLYAAYEIERTVSTVMAVESTKLDDGFLVGAGYGLTPEITVGAQYGFRPGVLSDAESELSGPLSFFGMYQAVNDGTLDITATGEFIYDLCGSVDMSMSCAGTMAITFGAGVRYKLAPEFAVFSGSPIGPGPVGRQFNLSLEDKGKMAFDLPAGLIYQANADLGLYIATNLMHINIANDDSVFFGADTIPILLGGSFELDKSMSVEAEVALGDISDGVDDLTFALGFRYYN